MTEEQKRNLANLEGAVEATLIKEQVITPERIRELIAQVRQVPIFSVSDEAAEHLARVFEERHSVMIQVGAALTARDYQPWLDAAKETIEPYYWDRYRKLLESKHFPVRVVTTLHEDADRVLGYLENPLKNGRWSRRGMVVGHVQSGKTANYTGLVCKAADAGYKLIVVIAGVHNNLRNQTQRRIEEGFVGRESARIGDRKDNAIIGVGKIDSRRSPATFTSSVKDFNVQTASAAGVKLDDLREPVVLVIKKNKKTLDSLIEWLKAHNKKVGATHIDAPMLLIDDEADNASINVAQKKGDIAAINGLIRSLLQLFSRNCYVGYTATPFANIFIDPDSADEMKGEDLFPRDFIVSLDAPSNYFGPQKVFRDGADRVVRSITDSEDLLPLKHKNGHVLTALPPSLRTAIRTFVVARAIRSLRGQERQHASMLINASRFTGVQGGIRELVQHDMEALGAAIKTNAGLDEAKALRNPEMSRLREIWSQEYADAGFGWADVQGVLWRAVSPIKVVEINSASSGSLPYEDYADTGLSVIAVGGFSLSRGLTLEGLTVSYFLRNSRAYDTLMQMGRWFGYRPDYEDLCRIWMPEEAAGWYAHIADATDELREEFRQMAAANATPYEFGLKVRAHPSVLEVTARNKMGSGERMTVRIGLTNRFVETSVIPKSALEVNRVAARALARAIEADGTDAPPQRSWRQKSYMVSGVGVEHVLTFLRAWQNHPNSLVTQPGPILQYIKDRSDGELREWDVLFPGVSSGDQETTDLLGFPIKPQVRSVPPSDKNSSALELSSRQRVASRGVEKFGLSPEQISAAESAYRSRQHPPLPDDAKVNYPDLVYRENRPRPLLVVHLLKLREGEPRPGRTVKDPDPVPEDVVVAWSLSFPKSAAAEAQVEYVVTRQWLRENGFDADDEVEEEEELADE